MKVVGFIIGAALIVAGILTGNVGLIIQGGAMIVTQAVVDLTMPKTSRQASEMTIALGEQPRVMLVGETFTPGSLVDAFDYGGKYGTDWEVLVIRLADHKCQSLTSFFVNDKLVPYTGDGFVSGYNSQLQIYFRSDTTAQALPAIVTAHGPRWASSDVGQSGCDVVVAYKADQPQAKNPTWPGGRPRFGFVVKGKLCYDPRKDSTVTGGSGSHRWTDPTTWEWSENAVICRYNWVRGVYANDVVTDPTKLLIGRGLSADEAPPENIFADANLCDAITGNIYPAQWAATDCFGRFLSTDGTTLYSLQGGAFSSFYLPTRTQLLSTTVTTGGTVGAPIAVTPSGVVYPNLTAGMFQIDPVTGSSTRIVAPADMHMSPNGCGYAGGSVWVYPHAFTPNVIGQLVGSALSVSTVGFNTSMVFTNAAGAAIALGTTTGNILAIGPAGGTATLINTSAYGTSGPAYGFDPNDGTHYIVRQGTYLFFVTKTTPAIVLAVNTGAALLYESFAATRVGASSFWNGNSQYKSSDLSLIRTINTTLFDPVPGIGGFEVSGYFFDPINDALLSATNAAPGLIFRFLDRHGGYRVAGPIYANQDFIDVETMFAAATGGTIITREGSVELEVGQPKSIVASFTDNDLVVGTKATWNEGFLSQSNQEWLNTVVAQYVEPDQKWNNHAAPVVRNTADIAADAKPREAQLTLRLVRYQAQALRVAEIARRLGRLWGRASVTLPPRFCQLEAGDWVNWTSARRFSGGTKTFRVEAFAINAKWQVTLTLREISAAAFAADGTFALDYSQPITTQPPVRTGAPTAGNWSLAPISLDSNGAGIPALEIAGSASDDAYVESIIFEYWKSDGVTDPTVSPDSIPWTSDGRFPPTTTKDDITSVTGGATYYAAVSYVVAGITGDRLVLGPVNLPDFVVGHRHADTTFITADNITHSADMA